jgi:hypothetical protein
MQNVLITYYSLPTCFDRRRGHHQGKTQDYKKPKDLLVLVLELKQDK